MRMRMVEDADEDEDRRDETDAMRARGGETRDGCRCWIDSGRRIDEGMGLRGEDDRRRDDAATKVETEDRDDRDLAVEWITTAMEEGGDSGEMVRRRARRESLGRTRARW
jgi:hypothetical protein